MSDPANVRRGRGNRARGAEVEREVAELYGGWRNIDRGGKWGDVQTEVLVIEVKSRQAATPQLIRTAWAQAIEAAANTGKDPLVVLTYIDGGKRSVWEVKKVE